MPGHGCLHAEDSTLKLPHIKSTFHARGQIFCCVIFSAAMIAMRSTPMTFPASGFRSSCWSGINRFEQFLLFVLSAGDAKLASHDAHIEAALGLTGHSGAFRDLRQQGSRRALAVFTLSARRLFSLWNRSQILPQLGIVLAEFLRQLNELADLVVER